MDDAEDFIIDENPISSKITAKDVLRKTVSMRAGGETRIEQETLVDAIEKAIADQSHSLSQAGTGAGKGLAYTIPVAISGKRAAISTASIQLSEQIFNKDLPTVNNTIKSYGGTPLSFALIKGRSNYLCKKALDSIIRLGEKDPNKPEATDQQDDLFADEEVAVASVEEQPVVNHGAEVTKIVNWSKRTKTGDRTEAPAVSDKIWKTVSVTNAECPGKNSCPFGDVCFAERARDIARASQIVIANHAVVGLDLISDNSLLGERDVLVIDEAHELDNYLSKAWGTTLTAKKVHDTAVGIKRVVPANETTLRDRVEELVATANTLDSALSVVPKGLIDALDSDVDITLRTCLEKINIIKEGLNKLGNETENKSVKGNYKSAMNRMRDVSDSISLLLTESIEVVRWYSREKKDENNAPATLHAAPLRIGPRLMSELAAQDTTFIATSATITVGGKFDSMVHNLALDESIEVLDNTTKAYSVMPPRDFSTLNVGTPFNYKKQGMIYIPDSDNFPTPTGAERLEHSKEVMNTALRLVEASGGRALILSTTTEGAKRIGDFLKRNLKKKKINHKVYVHGDAPAQQLADKFSADETSILCATMGMWHGLDVVGPSLSLVIIDKIPFAPFDEPLSLARQQYADSIGRNGFMDVYVANATIMLAQGAGRLVRSMQDRGVVAILDPRLLTKAYGRTMLKSLPEMNVYSDEEIIIQSLKRLTASYV